ncbi:uronyl 2-sulfotransferase homolog pip isoform X2 [Leptinotarsa decemlineata]|uniref:uronyl 2-sulfotransferase homolog pip isoform X2 n=1 Tax=Leptinotarsa decemlineata TaxID=7539 RepID=UPI003D30C1E5
MRFRLYIQWLLLTFLFTVFFSFLLLKKPKIESKTTTPTIEQRVSSPSPWKKVTKSLAELGKMDEVNKYVLFLNHVPKCGSEILILLLQKLQGFNNFRHIRLKGGNGKYMTNLEQEYLVYDIYDTIKSEAVPLSFDRHVYFINFTQFDKQFPTYINFIRNPVEKVISRMLYKNKEFKYDYYYKCLMSKQNNCNFRNGQTYDLSIPYFCGHNPRCMVLNSTWALQIAKNNVVRYFPVVGVLEEMNATLKILENKIPYFFKGATKVYENDLLNIPKYGKPKISMIVRRKLEESLVDEIDFYNWIKARLFKQLKIIYTEHTFH